MTNTIIPGIFSAGALSTSFTTSWTNLFPYPKEVPCVWCMCRRIRQTDFYFIDESQYTGKGVEGVVSRAHHYLQFYGIGEKHVQIHFHNAAGQNKTTMSFGMQLWSTLIGLHETVAMSILVTGHRKFKPD
ncbi:uncharacterized protein LOC128553911 [Mercenaria mercenaria]|uniref:uncharacterized protein LOC128553911 n=1 Tax=Mercenaria mercenaria TaxID=6596 RepID=UPI00234EE891|nr:uncharacterized protein LOC128553911 [Mercenaria mercenaria]